MVAATLLGMLVHLSSYSPLKILPGYSLNVIWSIFSVAIMALAIRICVEPPRRRLHERFATNEPALLSLSNGRTLSCVVRDLSIGGAHLECPAEYLEECAAVTVRRLIFTDGATVRFRAVRATAGALAVRFDDDAWTRRVMIAKLFTGAYKNEVGHVSTWSVLRTSVQTLLT